jgi:hypothetical protein
MKNKIKITGIAAGMLILILVIGFTMIACGDGGNVIPVKLRFSNSGTAPANSIQIAVSRSIPPPNYSMFK